MQNSCTLNRVAVVDDDQSVCTSLRRLLYAHGYFAETFTSAADFMRSGAIRYTHCLLLDFHLGDATGLDLLRETAAAGYHRPTIFMTGSGEEEIRKRCFDSGCLALLEKPIKVSKLLDALTIAFRPS